MPRYNMRSLIFRLSVLLIALAVSANSWGQAQPNNSDLNRRIATASEKSFPRLFAMAFMEQGINRPEIQAQIAKYQMAVLGFRPKWAETTHFQIRDVVKAIKRINPEILLGNYSILSEACVEYRDVTRERTEKLNMENWWLTKADGAKVSLNPKTCRFEINFTEFTRPDSKGRRYSEWAAEWYFHEFYSSVPEFDFWYFDAVRQRTWIKEADWKQVGVDQRGDDSTLWPVYRRGQAAHFKAAKKLAPEMLLVANTDNDLSSPEYKGLLDVAFLECVMGKAWSFETRNGWDWAMGLYRSIGASLNGPKAAVFGACGNPNDYKFFRFAFTSSLMGDGYFAFSDSDNYGIPPWFDEYNVQLGKPLEGPPENAYKQGVYRRSFENGLVFVNPSENVETLAVPAGYRHLFGRQDPAVNNGLAVSSVTIPPRDGVVLVKLR